MTYRMV